MIRRIVDISMTVCLLFLMAYQVTGETLHEWIGIGMTVLVIVHQILNRKWYSAVFKGKYNPYRMITTAVNILLLLSFALTALSGMSMSAHAVPFLYGMAPVSFAFLDYEKAGVLVFLENLLMLVFWAFIGDQAVTFCRRTTITLS
jgi:hypothetical protein